MALRIQYRAGDILTACDNELNVPTGYLGHAAMAIDDQYLIEAVISYPYIQIAPISSFEQLHPKHAVYRPVSPELGKAAVTFAIHYLRMSNDYKSRGMNVPPFSFSSLIPLDDLWSSIYCSKLVWLSYRYGTGYAFYNDYFLFTPEDLDKTLGRDPNFTLLYKHPEFQFFVDT